MQLSLPQLCDRFRLFGNRRLYIMPTRFGYLYAVMLVIMLLGSINYSNSLGHVLTFLLMSLGLVGMLHCYRNLTGIDLTSSSAESNFCGQPATFTLNLQNHHATHKLQLDLAHKAKTESGWNRFKRLKGYRHLTTVAQLPAHQTRAVNVELTAHQRGWLELHQLRISSVFPLGLFYCWFYIPVNARVVIYPKAAGSMPLPLSLSIGDSQPQHHIVGQDDFAGLTRYRSGEPIHAVAWKAMARDDVMRSKQFSSPQGQNLMLRWQDTDPHDGVEARLSQLCQWVVMAEQQGMAYGLSLPGTDIEMGLGVTHQQRCLKALALYD